MGSEAVARVMILCLLALIIVVLVYCVLSIVVILINIILVMCDIDYYYCLYSIYVATLYIELDLIYCLRAYRRKLALEGVVNNHPRNSAGVIRI